MSGPRQLQVPLAARPEQCLHPALKSLLVHAELSCRCREIGAISCQGVADLIRRKFRRLERGNPRTTQVKLFRINSGSAAEPQEGAHKHRMQLAQVAGPGGCLEFRERERRQGRAIARVAYGDTAKKAPRQLGDIINSLAQRWKRDPQHGNAEDEVHSQPGQTPVAATQLVGGEDQPSVHGKRASGADTPDLACLDDSQQHGLQAGGRGTHFVEEERAAVGQLEIAASGLRGAGEGPLFVSKELALSQFLDLRDGGCDEGTRAAGQVVNVARQPGLARAGLAGEQDGVVARRKIPSVVEYPAHGRRIPEGELVPSNCHRQVSRNRGQDAASTQHQPVYIAGSTRIQTTQPQGVGGRCRRVHQIGS